MIGLLVDSANDYLNPSYAFSLTLLAAEPAQEIGLIICNDLGDSKIESWKKGGRLYEETIPCIIMTQKSAKLKGIL